LTYTGAGALAWCQRGGDTVQRYRVGERIVVSLVAVTGGLLLTACLSSSGGGSGSGGGGVSGISGGGSGNVGPARSQNDGFGGGVTLNPAHVVLHHNAPAGRGLPAATAHRGSRAAKHKLFPGVRSTKTTTVPKTKASTGTKSEKGTGSGAATRGTKPVKIKGLKGAKGSDGASPGAPTLTPIRTNSSRS